MYGDREVCTAVQFTHCRTRVLRTVCTWHTRAQHLRCQRGGEPQRHHVAQKRAPRMHALTNVLDPLP